MKQFALSVANPSGVLERIQPPPGVPSGGLFSNGPNVIQVTLNLLFIFAILLALFMIIFSGIQWIASSGDKQKLQAARNRLTFAIVGLIIIFLAIFIVNLIYSFLGLG